MFILYCINEKKHVNGSGNKFINLPITSDQLLLIHFCWLSILTHMTSLVKGKPTNTFVGIVYHNLSEPTI